MKSLVYFFVFIFFSVFCYSQKLDFKEKYDQFLTDLKKENWDDSRKTCKKLLDYAESVDSLQTEKMVLRYLYIYTTAGLLSEQKLTKDKALKSVVFLKGKEMIMLPQTFGENCHCNCIQFGEVPRSTFYTQVSDSKCNRFFSIEYIHIPKLIREKAEQLKGKSITLKGKLKYVSAIGDIPRFKLQFEKGEYKIND